MTSGGQLKEREELILQAVVHTYITTAEAVGSRSIVKRYGLGFSPATVRNVMSDLEELGYLQQLHASSGRVPTDQGYRYYVDYLMRVQELTMAERARIERELSHRLSDADEVMRQTSHLLALVSHQTGIVEAPAESDAQVRRVELMAVSDERLAVLIADNYGQVRTMLIALEGGVDGDELPQINRFLNEHLQGVPVERLAGAIEAKMRAMLDEQRKLAERALLVLGLLPAQRPAQLFLDGATQLFEHPEFRDVAKAREVFSLLEEQERLVELLRAGQLSRPATGASVLIGSETRSPGLEGISVIASPYYVHDRAAGILGILGPRRMPYSRLTAVVDYTAGVLGRFLTRLAR
ncbi:MAG: heat-inducible transcription repressor HrcA [Candidatus Hydrogenedentes bacterium]|nr:heat-inducible transcription repressor HrcA [Candidatus Hydrogenedentota bacterium]